MQLHNTIRGCFELWDGCKVRKIICRGQFLSISGSREKVNSTILVVHTYTFPNNFSSFYSTKFYLHFHFCSIFLHLHAHLHPLLSLHVRIPSTLPLIYYISQFLPPNIYPFLFPLLCSPLSHKTTCIGNIICSS